MSRSRIPSSASNADTIMRLQTAAASDRAAGLNQTHSARVLVVCYSRKGENYAPGGTEVLEIGHTAKMAQLISALTGGDLYEIQTEKNYPANYRETTRIAEDELRRDEKPMLAGTLPDLSKYDLIFLGHPIWWGKLPPAVNSFLSAANLSGKEVAHFCTHAGSGFGTSDRELRTRAPNAQFLESLSVVGTEVDRAKVQIENWVRRVLNR